DRVGLRDGPTLISIGRVAKFVSSVRKAKYDFVIDLHSYYETNILGFFPGAGHAGRIWPLERFAEVADHLIRNDRVRVIVFAGPEERAIVPKMKTIFPAKTIIFDR